MTLSLEEVRSKRFRMARKSGYEVLEVDEFVDQVEATFEQLFEENQNLKKQVEALKSSAGTAAAPATDPASSPAAAAPTSPPPAVEPSERLVVTTSSEASSAVVRLVQMSAEQAERLVAEASAEAARIREEASTSAEQVEREARTVADQVQAEARQRAEELDRDVESRRGRLFSELEQEREQLSSTVHALRAFEATYRQNLTRHLQSQIEVLASGHEEPAGPPPGLLPVRTGEPAAAGDQPSSDGDAAPQPHTNADGTSGTPRLDALLGDQR